MRHLRVLLITQHVIALSAMARACRRAGHHPVLATCTRARSPRGGQVSDQRAAQAMALVDGAPSSVGVTVLDDIDSLCESVERWAPDVVLTWGFPWLLPARLLSVPPYGAVNVHPSRLPALRGPFPVHWAIRNGDTKLAVTVHRMDARFDTGPMLATVPFDVSPDATGPDIWRRVAAAAERAVDAALPLIARRDPGTVQPDGGASYAGPFSRDEVIDQERSVAEAHNLMRAWSLGSLGSAGPLARLDGTLVRVLRISRTPIDAPRLDCADGPLWLEEYRRVEFGRPAAGPGAGA